MRGKRALERDRNVNLLLWLAVTLKSTYKCTFLLHVHVKLNLHDNNGIYGGGEGGNRRSQRPFSSKEENPEGPVNDQTRTGKSTVATHRKSFARFKFVKELVTNWRTHHPFEETTFSKNTVKKTKATPENRGIQKMEIHFFPQKIIACGQVLAKS